MKLLSLPSLYLMMGCMLLLFSCKEKEDLTLKALERYQSVLDTKINTFQEEQITIRQSIDENAAASQDTFELAKSLIPLRTTQFLLESKYDELTTMMKDYQAKKINGQKVQEALKSQKEYVKDLLEKNNLN